MHIRAKHRNLGFIVAALGLIAMAAALRAEQQGTSGGPIVQGVTKPYVPAKPWFNSPGTVMEVPVEKGQTVKKGDILIKQDDRMERAELAKLELEASSTARIDAAVGDLKIKHSQLDRFVELQKTGSANPFEIEEARSKVIYGEAQVKVETLNRDKAKQDAEKQRVKVELMTIKSPVNGRVEQIEAEVGDITDPQKPVISVVQNDPLKVKFFLPIQQSNKLKLGAQAEVRYPNEDKWMPAKVTIKSPLADAASDTQEIGLEMPNAEGRDSGMQVQVRLPADISQPTPGAANADQKP